MYLDPPCCHHRDAAFLFTHEEHDVRIVRLLERNELSHSYQGSATKRGLDPHGYSFL
jgi:hypothetical protein